jgi:hypothetical protein
MADWELGVEKEDGWHVMAHVNGPESNAQYWADQWSDVFPGLQARPRGTAPKKFKGVEGITHIAGHGTPDRENT